MSDLNGINREELRGLVQEGLIDWLQQAKEELESQGVDFSDGVDGEEIGKILSYGGEKLRGAFDDILSRFGGDELGSEEAIETAAEEVEDSDSSWTQITKMLNDLGSQGWELVSTKGKKPGKLKVFYLKRPL